MARKGKNDLAWEYLFATYNILDEIEKNGYCSISANRIKESNREPRLMTKFDSYEELPDIFKKYELSILPVTRGSYVIGKFKNYQEIEINNSIEAETVYLPDYVRTIDPNVINSEAISINASFISGMIEKTVNDSTLLPTIQGRMSTSDFNFNILLNSGNQTEVEVSNSQMEIDGAYEGKDKFVIIEAKNRFLTDFIVRQLYYPYRYWKSKINKEIIPIMLVKHNDIFNFFVYDFSDDQSYNSIKLKYVKRFLINEKFGRISMDEIKELLLITVSVDEDPVIPFPQADSFERVLDFYDVVGERSISLKEIAELYDFDIRQASYYSSAARYIGLVSKDSNGFTLTPLGKTIKNLQYKDRMIEIIKQIIKHEPFRVALQQYHESGVSNKQVIADLILNLSPRVKSPETAKRRSQTVISWIRWIMESVSD